MPIYVYKCKKCGEIHEALQKFSDPPLKICPSCEGELEKQFSGQVGLHFQGSGFYITDYARNIDNKGNGKSNGKASEKSTASTSESD
ncbi:MAG: zinc ribbon domain-containing protein [candidate division KSB1 bacterium]|nr:zinc ribbon domain-containing protein [candidate division KSB1 bacterium]